MEATTTVDERKQAFAAKAQSYEAEAANLGRYNGSLVLLRGALFLVMVPSGLAGWLILGAGPIGFSVCGASFVALVATVMYHERLRRIALELETRALIQRQSAARIDRRWDDLPNWRALPPDHFRSESQDLDLFGSSSLFRWICRANTPGGVRLLRDWIADPAPPEEIESRQAAVKRLTEEVELREELAVHGHLLSFALSDPDLFLQWMEGEGWYRRRIWLLYLARGLTLLFLILTAAFFLAPIPREWTGFGILAVIATNVILSVSFTGSMHDVFFQVTTPSGEMGLYRELFRLMSILPDDDPRLAALKDVVTDRESGADHQLRSLSSIMGLANLRRAGLFGAVYLLLQIFVLWDFHVMALLEHWRRRTQLDARRWFDALSELEALMSLAGAAHDHPDWIFPKVDLDQEFLAVERLGHPLLDPKTCVRNDVSLGPTGSFLLVTGSNMSGKSTLLRALGLNAVLAHMGSAVCAASYQGPPVVVATSMRIVDSLDDGVSFFMAELKRLKEIVDHADGFRDPQGPVLLYLLDEILQGTNSRERHIAVARVVAHLMQCRAIGAISTHDLELSNEPNLRGACSPVHFREQFEEVDGEKRMTFDYRMREGVAQTTNALALLELVGLEENPPKDSANASDSV